jgi:hypothetical protein
MMQASRDTTMLVADVQRLKMKRLKRGECPDCGTVLYKTTTTMLGRVKKSIPINEAGKCSDGRCLVCVPLNTNVDYDIQHVQQLSPSSPQVETTPSTTEVKKVPIPRIILIYQSTRQTQNDGNSTSLMNASKVDLGLFGLDLDDDLSDITLDRRIRDGQHTIDCTNNSSNHEDDLDDHFADDSSDKSISKMLKGSTSQAVAATTTNNDSLQESYRNKMKQLFLPAINLSEPLQVRMARLLNTDIPINISASQIPDEEIDSKPYGQIIGKSSAAIKQRETHIQNDPEQPLPRSKIAAPSSSRKLESAEDSVEGMEDDNDNYEELEAVALEYNQQTSRRQSLPEAHHLKSDNTANYVSNRRASTEGLSSIANSTKKVFRPNNVFVSHDLPGSPSPQHPIIDIIVEQPLIKNGRPGILLDKPDIYIERPDIIIERPDTSVDKRNILKGNSERDERKPKGSTTIIDEERPMSKDSHMRSEKSDNKKTEIVFDLTAISSLTDKKKSVTERNGIGEASHVTDDSLLGFATDNSSSHNIDTAEYSVYSSKLLMMLEQTDQENDYSIGSTWPSFRIPRITAGNDDINFGSSNKGSEAANITGDVYKETGIPKVVYSSNMEISNNEISLPGADTKNETIEVNSSRSSHPVTVISLKSPQKPADMPSKKHPPSDWASMKGSSSTFKLEHLGEIDHLLKQLEKIGSNDCSSILSRLSEILWMSNVNPQIWQHFIQSSGAKILATTMWASMSSPQVEEAAFGLFLALITVPHVEVINLNQWNDDLSGLIDALMIAMQSNLSDVNIQKTGCRIFCCLASSDGNEIDGTRSGACLAVLNAMDMHSTVNGIQEWGLRALVNQSTRSKFADTNKRIVLSSKLDNSGSTGVDVLQRIMRSSDQNMRCGGVLEWAYQLCWCLTASKSIRRDLITLRMDSIRDLLHMLESCRSTTDASPQLQEAGLGLIANLVRIDYYKSFLGTPDVILLILDTMLGNKEFVEVQIEACNAIANICMLLAPVDKEELIDAGIIRTIVGAMYAFPKEKHILQEPALRALLGLANGLEVAKAEICESNTLSVIMQTCHMDENSTVPQQEILCKLLASLYTSDRLMQNAIQSDTIGAITAAVSTFRNSEKIAEAGCSAYRSLSRNESNFDALIRYNVIGFVVLTMATYIQTKSIQINACWVLWNLGVGTDVGPHKIAETDAMKHVVVAIQTHLDSYEVIDVACGTLWNLIHRSNVLRQDFCSNITGLESVICTLVMHPDKMALLETACGILAYISRDIQEVPNDVISAGVSNVIETMCNNPRSLMILQHGAHFVRNIIATYPQYVTEATNVIGALMNAIKGVDVPIPFLGEILYFLWVVSEMSSEAKKKVISMDGIPLTMSILDQFRGSQVPFVEDPALGLFEELANEPSHRK